VLTRFNTASNSPVAHPMVNFPDLYQKRNKEVPPKNKELQRHDEYAVVTRHMLNEANVSAKRMCQSSAS